jgi:hypothetical protein
VPRYFDPGEFVRSHSFVPIDSDSSLALRRASRIWMDTPFSRGSQIPGIGVDCVRFVAAVYDDLFQTETAIPEDREDPSMIRAVRRGWFGLRRIFVPRVHPGDLIAVKRPKTGKIVHLALVSTIEGEIWQASRLAGRVVRDGFQSLAYPFTIFRPEERHRWSLRK